jgi:hypothetical protein
LEGTTNSSDWAAANFFTVNESNSRHGHENRTKFAYYQKTLDPRYSSFEGLRDDDFYKGAALEYDKLDSIIKFFYLVNYTTNKGTFNQEAAINKFESYFNLDYVLTYYL